MLKLEIPIRSAEELAALKGALLAARASELSQIRRRSARHGFGYGSDSARETMSAEVDQAELRHEMLDRLLAALTGNSKSRSSGVAMPHPTSVGLHFWALPTYAVSVARCTDRAVEIPSFCVVEVMS